MPMPFRVWGFGGVGGWVWVGGGGGGGLLALVLRGAAHRKKGKDADGGNKGSKTRAEGQSEGATQRRARGSETRAKACARRHRGPRKQMISPTTLL